MTVRSFSSWVNDDLFHNSTLESGTFRKISVEVGRIWLHSMGFEVKKITKGIYSAYQHKVPQLLSTITLKIDINSFHRLIQLK